MTAIDLYHETFGEPDSPTTPLLLLPGGGSNIQTNWSAIVPALSAGRRVIAVDMQGHGRTPNAERPYNFANSAGDVVAMLERLGLSQVDVLGFSNGGSVALYLSLHHPQLVRRQIVASTPYRRDGMVDGFWDGLAGAEFERDFPAAYREADRAINPDPQHQRELFDLDTSQMLNFVDWSDDDLRGVSVPTLFVVGDQDVVRVSHVVRMAGLVPEARLLVLPATHGDYLGEVLASQGDTSAMTATVPWLLRFLDET